MTETVWMYFETDGDSGYYAIRLFGSEALAQAWKARQNSAYGGIKKIEVTR